MADPTWTLIYGEAPQYTKPETRIYMNNIPTGLTEGQLAYRLRENYGPVQIHYFSKGAHNDGYAWIGFEEEEGVRKAMAASSTPRPLAPPKPL